MANCNYNIIDRDDTNVLVKKEYDEESYQQYNCTNLIGMDEHQVFEEEIDSDIETVDNAVDYLRPDVSDSAIRQGDLFFDPEYDDDSIFGNLTPLLSQDQLQSNDSSNYLNKTLDKGDTAYKLEVYFDNTTNIGRTSHRADKVVHIRKKEITSDDIETTVRAFAKGNVLHDEHSELVLGATWHEVKPNTNSDLMNHYQARD